MHHGQTKQVLYIPLIKLTIAEYIYIISSFFLNGACMQKHHPVRPLERTQPCAQAFVVHRPLARTAADC